MPDSEKPKKRRGRREPRPEERPERTEPEAARPGQAGSKQTRPERAADPEQAPDPGHARAREVSEARNAAKSRGSAALGVPSAPDDRPETDAERLRRRARFLRERSEARELRDRVQPRRTRTARLRQAMRMRTFRW